MNKPTSKRLHIAPCGMVCSLCLAYQREKNHCPGCRALTGRERNSCAVCVIRTCPTIRKPGNNFCHSCGKIPCKRLKALDKRYRARYGMSFLENLETIKKLGVTRFSARIRKKWTCKKCGELLSVHRPVCLKCGAVNRNYPR